MPSRNPPRLSTFREANVTMNYADFKRHVHTLLNDTAVSDNELEVRAREHLSRVLDDPLVAPYNKLPWNIDTSKNLISANFSTKRAFEAMYTTAADLGLETGGRYVSACICACALPSRLGPSLPILPIEVVTQAKMMSVLACDIWLARMWRCLPELRPQELRVMSLSSVSHETRRIASVLRRDDYTCFKTGKVDQSAPRSMISLSTQTASLQVVPICNPSLPEHWLLREWTIDFFRFYLGVDVTAIQLDSPRNCLLLDRMASKAFTGHYWTLRPTEVVNRYRVADSTVGKVFGTNARDGDYITFEDCTEAAQSSPAAASGLDYYFKAVDGFWSLFGLSRRNHDSAIEDRILPCRDALLIHAACTSFLHQCGIVCSPAEFIMPPGFFFDEY